MLTDEQKELKDIETFLYKKFKNLEYDSFYFDGDVISYDELIEKLTERAYRECWEDEIQLDQIEEKRWNKWIKEYELPEKSCSCNRGCMSCLGLNW